MLKITRLEKFPNAKFVLKTNMIPSFEEQMGDSMPNLSGQKEVSPRPYLDTFDKD